MNLGTFGGAKPTRNTLSKEVTTLRLYDSRLIGMPQPGTSKVGRKGGFAIVPYLPGTGNQIRRTTDDVV